VSPNFVRYGPDGVEHVTEVADILLSNGMSLDEIFTWFARRQGIGPFAKGKR